MSLDLYPFLCAHGLATWMAAGGLVLSAVWGAGDLLADIRDHLSRMGG